MIHENDHQHRLRGFKVTISMSFGEFIFSSGFIQKTFKVDQIIKVNHAYPQQKLPQKVPEDSRRHHTEAKAEVLTCGPG